MSSRKFATFLLSASLLATFTACDKDNDDDNNNTAPTTVREWNLALAARNETPAPAGRTETGTANVKLLSDNSLTYSITINNLAAGDALTAAHIHSGDPATSGPVVQGLNPTFTNGTATGTITGLRSSFVDSLRNNTAELYLNVHSTQAPAGIVRAQMNSTVELAWDIPLSGTNEVPAVTTTATGTALLRLTTDKKLYAKINVSNLEAGDALTAAHIHPGATGTNGGVLIGLYSSAADFGTVKVITLTDAQYTALKNDALYVNAHSSNHSSGLIRGQIR